MYLQTRLEGWQKFAGELTRVIQCIIEFAKLVEGFMQLSQEEQISLVKSAVFELATIVVSQHYNAETTSLVLEREVITASMVQSSDQEETSFIMTVYFLLK